MHTTDSRSLSSFLLIVCITLLTGNLSYAAGSPYPQSPIIQGINYDWSTREIVARGSDNWPITWASDGHQYTSWGDGNGFGSTRQSLGVARVNGTWNNYSATNIWAGRGKAYGLLAIFGSKLYMWVRQASQVGKSGQAWLASSQNNGISWSFDHWGFPESEQFNTGTFLQFGQDYAGARDDYVYSYFIRSTNFGFTVTKPGKIDLARVPKDQVTDQSAFEFFAGLSGGKPTWTSKQGDRKAVFEDPNGVSWVMSATYNAGLKRYIINTEHGKWSYQDLNAKMGIFDAPEPWGPWTTVDYETNNGSFPGWTWVISNKWTSSNGRNFTVIYTQGDSWGTVRARFNLRGQ